MALPSGSPQRGRVPWGEMCTGKHAIKDHCDMVTNKVGATGVNSLGWGQGPGSKGYMESKWGIGSTF